jgi:hypothetical protein
MCRFIRIAIIPSSPAAELYGTCVLDVACETPGLEVAALDGSAH